MDALLQISKAILFPIPNIYVSAMFTFLLVGMLTPDILAIGKSKKNEWGWIHDNSIISQVKICENLAVFHHYSKISLIFLVISSICNEPSNS